jgi:hypothetical protein
MGPRTVVRTLPCPCLLRAVITQKKARHCSLYRRCRVPFACRSLFHDKLLMLFITERFVFEDLSFLDFSSKKHLFRLPVPVYHEETFEDLFIFRIVILQGPCRV